MSLEYKFENRGTVQVRPTGSDRRNICWYILILVVIALLGTGIWLFFGGYLTPADSSGVHAMSLRGKMNEQEKMIGQQLDKIKSLEEQLATVRRELQVQTAANEELSKKFSASAADLVAAKEKIKLYDGIVSPSDQEEGLNIQHFGIKPRLADAKGKKVAGLYQYHLELSNLSKDNNEKAIDGSYSIIITGRQNGKEVVVTQKDVTPDKEKVQTRFSVKRYQNLDGSLLFPKNFTPTSVKLKVSPSTGDTPAHLTQSYDWATVSDSNSPTQQE